MSARWSRRRFLVRVATAGAGTVVSLVLPSCGGEVEARIELEGLLDTGDETLRLGRRYLERHPEEADASLLRDALLGGPDGAADAERVRAVLGERIRADFAAQRLFRYRGWLLSRTEGRLCALAALTSAD